MISTGQVLKGASFYPVSIVYVAAVAVVSGITIGFLSVPLGLVALGLVALLATMLATLRELRTVHTLVDGQRTELLARIDQLVDLLEAAGVIVPPRSAKEQEARAQDGSGEVGEAEEVGRR